MISLIHFYKIIPQNNFEFLSVLFEVRVPREKASNYFDVSVLKTMISTCNFEATMMENVFLRPIYESFVKKCVTFEMKCPRLAVNCHFPIP